ncbi:AAA family ATPase [Ligilactobacillus equi]|uniref:ParA family protein n=1 Tax=Ligilactobacillus equi TaxID=137357 RepID=UPI002ED5BE0A
MTATVMSFANFKGGVGKTTSVSLVGYNLAKKGYKVLAIDLDPQANLTSIYLKTTNPGGIPTVEAKQSLMSAIVEDISLDETIVSIRENLDLVPNSMDFSYFPRFLESNFSDEIDRVAFLKKKIAPLKEKYDFIFLDVAPTISLQNDNAFYACDQIILVLQTQEHSFEGATKLLQYLQTVIVDTFKAYTDVLGILPVLSKNNGAVDEKIIDVAKDTFGPENLFKERIFQMERIKRMAVTGITDNERDAWDKKVHAAYGNVADELVERLGK